MADLTFGPKGWTPERLGDLSGKTFIITGANAGAGFQAARILLGRGAEVVMLNRSAEKSTVAVAALQDEFGPDAAVHFILMDLAEQASVRAAAQEVLRTVPRIDALICNAAIAQVPTRRLTADGFESQLGTNHYGHFTLCGMLFDRIDTNRGRIVVVASLGYNMGTKTIRFDDMNWDRGYGANAAYSQSKLAQMMFAYELQDRVKAARRNVAVYVCHPGSSATSLISTSGSRAMRLVWWLMTKTPMVQTAWQGAYHEVMCATEEALPQQRALYGPTGVREFVGPVGRGTLNAHAHDKPVMVRLWQRSEKDTGHIWSL